MEEKEQLVAPNEATKLQETSEMRGPKKNAQIYFTLSQLAVRSSDRSGPDSNTDGAWIFFIRDLAHILN